MRIASFRRALIEMHERFAFPSTFDLRSSRTFRAASARACRAPAQPRSRPDQAVKVSDAAAFTHFAALAGFAAAGGPCPGSAGLEGLGAEAEAGAAEEDPAGPAGGSEAKDRALVSTSLSSRNGSRAGRATMFGLSSSAVTSSAVALDWSGPGGGAM